MKTVTWVAVEDGPRERAAASLALLVNAGASVNATSEDGHHLLVEAVFGGKADAAEVLIADVDLDRNALILAPFVACAAGHPALLDRCLGAAIASGDFLANAPLEAAWADGLDPDNRLAEHGGRTLNEIILGVSCPAR